MEKVQTSNLDKEQVGAEVLFIDNQICFPLYAASRLTTQLYAPILNVLGLTYPQYLVMMVLWQYHELTVNEICSKLILESNTVTPLLKRLEKKGLLVRKRSTKDERNVLVTLTEEGLMLRDEAVSVPAKIFGKLNSEEVTKEELLSFKNTLLKLLQILKHE
ncbi:MAG: MarR family winged helix-turn-helix transcriptional regulator [Bacteroidales bacterium]